MGLLQEFKTFAIKGNALDLAIGVIIGGAFGKIVTSLVNDIIMPPVGLLVSNSHFKDIKFVIKKAVLDSSGTVTSPEVVLAVGSFIQSVIDFVIISFVIFLLIKMINAVKKKEEEKTAAPPESTNEEKLLMEIRDLLKNNIQKQNPQS
jgi:large conductance mechanosensitive channel